MKMLFTRVLSASLLGIPLATAVTITFDDLPLPDSNNQIVVTQYDDKKAGFKIFSPDSDVDFGSWLGSDFDYAGSAGLFNNFEGSNIVLEPIESGTTFSLQKIDLAYLYSLSSLSQSAKVHFTGYVHGGTTVEESFTLGGPVGFTSFEFEHFTNLTRVSWQQGAKLEPDGHQFDNIVINEPTGTVPDGGTTLALLGLALTTLAGVRRKFGV